MMNLQQFKATAIAILRSAAGWQTGIAHKLDVEPRTVRRWLRDGLIPAWVDTRLAEMTGQTDLAPWPRDEWMVGDAICNDGRRREYLVHLQPPRFIARVVAMITYGQPEPSELPADIVSGVVFTTDKHTMLCEFAWIDQPPPGEVAKWLEAAADALEKAE